MKHLGDYSIPICCHPCLKIKFPLIPINGIHFHIDQKELTPELLFEVSPGLNGKNTSVCFLVKKVFGLSCGSSILEKSESPEDFFLIAAQLLWA